MLVFLSTGQLLDLNFFLPRQMKGRDLSRMAVSMFCPPVSCFVKPFFPPRRLKAGRALSRIQFFAHRLPYRKSQLAPIIFFSRSMLILPNLSRLNGIPYYLIFNIYILLCLQSFQVKKFIFYFF